MVLVSIMELQQKKQRQLEKINKMKELITRKFLPVELGGMEPLEFDEDDNEAVKELKVNYSYFSNTYHFNSHTIIL